MSADIHPARPTVTGRPVALALAIVLLILAALGGVSRNFFLLYDDDVYVTNNPHVASGLNLDNIRWALTSMKASNWHPLTWISHMVDVALFGLAPAGHHLVNLLWHAAASVLLFLVLWRLTGALWRSWGVAVLFGIHPLHVESVAWVAERKDLLCAFFWFLALGVYLFYLRRPGIGRYLALLLCFGLGLLSKPMIVTLPFLLLLLDYWPLGRWGEPVFGRQNSHHRPWGWRPGFPGTFGLLAEKIPLLALSAVSGVLTFTAQRHADTVVPLDYLPLSWRLANALRSYLLYLVKTVWPAKLAVFYAHPLGDLAWGRMALYALVFAAATTTAVALRSRFPFLFLGWFWYLGTLAPVIGLVQVSLQAMADRYTYVPLVGIFLLLVWGAAGWASGRGLRRGLLAAAFFVVVACLGLATRFQVRHWRDSLTLLEHAALVEPDNHWTQLDLGVVCINLGEYDKAQKALGEAIRIIPGWAEAHYQLGFLHVNRGEMNAALEEYKTLERLDRSLAMKLKMFIDRAGT